MPYLQHLMHQIWSLKRHYNKQHHQLPPPTEPELTLTDLLIKKHKIHYRNSKINPRNVKFRVVMAPSSYSRPKGYIPGWNKRESSHTQTQTTPDNTLSNTNCSINNRMKSTIYRTKKKQSMPYPNWQKKSRNQHQLKGKINLLENDDALTAAITRKRTKLTHPYIQMLKKK